MEVCVETLAAAINAENGGASRIELCANIVEGGTTPSVGLLRVVKRNVSIPVFVMIRPRGGDFLYTDDELEIMQEDIISAKANAADGIVLGLLTCDGCIDISKARHLIGLARPLPVTFHRAFDMTCDYQTSLEDVISLGCERLLTSGQELTALEGLLVIKELVKRASKRILVVPAGGITEENVHHILVGTGAHEFHSSARSPIDSLMLYRNVRVVMGSSYAPNEFQWKITSMQRVKKMVEISQGTWNKN